MENINMAEFGLTKSDLCSDLKACIHAVSMVAVGTDIVVTSGIDKDGHLKLLPYIQNGKTIAMIGSSRVGKSTLINRLLGENRLETNGLRNDDKGRHTTTRRELFLLKQGGMVIDTPGMRELGLWDVDEGWINLLQILKNWQQGVNFAIAVTPMSLAVQSEKLFLMESFQKKGGFPIRN